MPRVRIGQIWMDALTFEGAIDAIERLIGRGGAVYTPNVDHVVRAETNAALRDAYAAADLSLADGQWVVWASRLLGTPLPEKISGSDFAIPVIRRVSQRGQSVYLLGGAPGAAEGAARRLERECGAKICGVDPSRIDLNRPDPAVVERIRKASPAVVLVALGAPKQEIWIQRHLPELRPAVLIGVGGTLEFLSGQIQRAPAWISKSGLEWAFRLIREPRRLARRYLIDDPKFAAIVLRTAREPRARRNTVIM